MTPLLSAAAQGHVETAEVLIAGGADVNQRWTNGWTSLMLAAQGGHTNICESLLRNGAHVGEQNQGGATALYIAAYHAHTGIVQLLLSTGSEVNTPNRYGFTPLHAAAERNQPGIASCLLKAGASVDARTDKGLTPLDSAAAHDGVEVLELLCRTGARAKPLPKLPLVTAKTFFLLARWQENEGKTSEAVRAYTIAAEHFEQEAAECQRSARVLRNQAHNEAIMNSILVLSTVGNAYGAAYSSPFGVGFSGTTLVHTVDPMQAKSFPEKAKACEERAQHCRDRISQLGKNQ